MATEFEFPDGMDPQVFMDSEGREIPNPNPIVFHLPGQVVTEYDRVRELIARELAFQASVRGEETFDEANDFDVDDDMFPVSAHEYTEDTEAADREALAQEQERQARAKKAKKGKKDPQAAPGDPPEGSGEVADLPHDPAPE